MNVRALVALLSVSPVGFTLHASAQPADTAVQHRYEKIVSQIVSSGLASGKAYSILRELTGTVGARLSGSPAAGRAVAWAERTMESFDFQNVHTEAVIVPHWVRGSVEEASILGPSNGAVPLTICALG